MNTFSEYGIPKELLHNHRGEVPWDFPCISLSCCTLCTCTCTSDYITHVRIAKRPRRSHAVISCSYSDMCLLYNNVDMSTCTGTCTCMFKSPGLRATMYMYMYIPYTVYTVITQD